MTDEAIIGLDHEVMSNFGVGAMFIYRKYQQLLRQRAAGMRRQRRPLSRLDVPTTPARSRSPRRAATALCDQTSYTGYYFNGPTLHSNTIEENIDQYRTYPGLELTARKAAEQSLDDEHAATSCNHEKFFAVTPRIDYLDPTNRAAVNMIDGYEDGTRNGPHVFKLSGMYQLPWDITASAIYNAHSNFPFNPYDRRADPRQRARHGDDGRSYPANSQRSAGGPDARPELRQGDPARRRAPRRP